LLAGVGRRFTKINIGQSNHQISGACLPEGFFLPETIEKAETPLDDARALGILQPNIQQRCWMGSKRL